jgi:hypothetical protein
MRMPRIPQNIQIRDSETLAIRGLNLTENFTDGDLEYVKNISTDHYPYFEPIRKDDPIETAATPDDVFYWDGKIIYLHTVIDQEFGENSATFVYEVGNADPIAIYSYNFVEVVPRHFAAISGKLLIMPDKAIIEKTEEGYTAYNAAGPQVSLSTAVYSGHTITVDPSELDPGGTYGGFGTTIHIGQVLDISGSSLNDGIMVVITDVDRETGVITVDKTLTDGTESNSWARMEGQGVPELEFICSHNNRIWGCSTVVENGFKKQMIYASALGNPYVYDDYSSLIGGWTTEVECDDDWTGCAALPSTVLFFKEKKILRVLGDDPSEYAVYTSNCEGVKKGSWKSLLNINDAIFYLGAHGVYIYSGSIPTRISERLGDRLYGDAVAGTDGVHYYIQMAEVDMDYARQTPYTLFVYNIMQGFWTANGESDEKFSFSQGNTLGVTYLKGGKLYMTNPANDSEGIEFEMILKPLYATITGSYNRQSQVFGMKRYLKTSVRMECGDEGTYILYCKFDDGDWEEIGRRLPETPSSKKSGVDYYAIPNNHCDKFQMRITGKGNVRLLGIQREYALAGRR